jgi:hypothetical protein
MSFGIPLQNNPPRSMIVCAKYSIRFRTPRRLSLLLMAAHPLTRLKSADLRACHRKRSANTRHWDSSQVHFNRLAHVLLERLKTVLTLDWRKRVDARARVLLAIEDILDENLPRAYTPELYQGKCKALFEHVYENYVVPGLASTRLRREVNQAS